ncbi:hypothetical protein CDD83_8541 [Cordyceps sp. RAO-2017]|nr:hypothetical protein CDD83_8541 [Cordyceps sp. RAO-2017]
MAQDKGNHDFEFAQRGLVAPVKDPLILSDSDKEVVWNAGAYDFLQADCPDTANAALWRQGQLCSVTAGLYQVTEGVFQLRGLDLANMSIVRIPNTNGVVIVDCLTSVETARRGLELYQEFHAKQLGKEAEIKALLYTHCHLDHFGGAQAVVDKAGPDLVVVGPDGFLEHAVSENIGCGLGQALSSGVSSLVAPGVTVRRDGPLEPAVPGLEIVCQLTPGTEAPAEVNYFFPAHAALCMAENATHTQHNIQTLRGAPVRDARLWSRYLDESLALFGGRTDVVFATHHWPTWRQGDEDLVRRFLAGQRDYYAYLHNETLRQLNDGKTAAQIAEGLALPPGLRARTDLGGFYGSLSHNVKGVYDKYMGWFDGNPAALWAPGPVELATEYVRCAGGRDEALRKAREYRAAGNLRFAAVLLDHLVFADAADADAKDELAAVYTSLGQGAENGTWRNIYLTGAQELRAGPQTTVQSMSPSFLAALSLDQLFDLVAIRVDGPRAGRHKGLTLDFMVDGLDDKRAPGGKAGWHLRLSNGAVTGHAVRYLPPKQTRDDDDGAADLTAWLSHEALCGIVAKGALGQTSSFDGVTTVGDTGAWDTIVSFVTIPNPAFNIVTPWAPKS